MKTIEERQEDRMLLGLFIYFLVNYIPLIILNAMNIP